MDRLLTATTLLAALGSGLIAGAFFAFSAFVLAALARLPARSGIAAMQSIIVAIKSPLFLTVFFGTAALAASWTKRKSSPKIVFETPSLPPTWRAAGVHSISPCSL